MIGNVVKKILVEVIVLIIYLLISSFIVQVNASEEVILQNTWDVSANDGKSNVMATLYSDGSFIISGEGAMYDYSSILDVPYFDSLFKIKTIKFENGVTRIGEYSFSRCSTLTSIEISNSVKSIGKEAFYLCEGLSNVNMGNGIIRIEDFAFFGCDRLISINIPDCTIYMGYRPFSYCSSLTSINVDENNKNYSSQDGVLFNKSKTILECYPSGKQTKVYNVPDSVISIGQVVFDRCNYLEKIVIPSSVTNIHWDAFSDTYLKNIEVDEDNENYSSVDGVLFNKGKTILMCYPPRKEQKQYNVISSVVTINNAAFQNCINLKNIEIPSSVTEISSWAFDGCSKLNSIKIPSSVTKIGIWAFNGCHSLKSIEVDENNTKYSSESEVLFNKDKTKLIRYPSGKKEEKYEIPLSVIEIDSYAFEGAEFFIIVEQNANSIELPELIRRAINENDILYAEEILLENCSIDEKGENLLINTDKLQVGEYATIKINSGNLEGTMIYITNGIWDISKNGDKSVIATLSKDGTFTISGQGEMKDYYIYQPYNKIKDIIKSAKILKGVTNIETGTFDFCTNLTSIEIADSVTSIGRYAFYECSNLKNINIPHNVTWIGDDAFYGCDDLKISCTINSYAQEYAESNGILYIATLLKGDANGDNRVDFKDILAINKHRFGKGKLEGLYFEASDITGDGIVDFKDILRINKYRLGKSENL